MEIIIVKKPFGSGMFEDRRKNSKNQIIDSIHNFMPQLLHHQNPSHVTLTLQTQIQPKSTDKIDNANINEKSCYRKILTTKNI